MQSFSPLYTYEDCAKVLDNKRCFKNALEAYQVLRVIRGKTTGNAWRNHPVTRMWVNNSNSYVEYALHFLDEWRRRGYKTTMDEKIKALYVLGENTSRPSWWGREEFHASHRGTLKSKNAEHYRRFGWVEEAKYEYWWPTNHGY